MKRLVFTGVLLLTVVCLFQGCVLAVAGLVADHEMTKSDYDSYVKDNGKITLTGRNMVSSLIRL